MKKILLQISSLLAGLFISVSAMAQTAGILNFSFTEVSKTASSTFQSQGNHVLAVWIQNNAGTFVKTKIRNGGLNSTADHLPTWAVNSGGTANNCMSANCNVVTATTGATLSSFGNRSITWDGTDVNGNIVADGTYKVTIEETWNHGGTGATVRSFTFIKGPNSDIQSPTTDANFSNISLAWQPTASGIEENVLNSTVNVHPNPSSNGIFNVDFAKAENIKVTNLAGEVIFNETVKSNEVSKSINLSNFNNGIYFIFVTNGNEVSKHKVVLEK